jgi:ATP-dependent DNA helicase RecG
VPVTTSVLGPQSTVPSLPPRLVELGIHTSTDLLEYFPRDYVQEFPERDIAALEADQIQSARGEVIAVDFVPGHRPRFVATVSDGRWPLGLVFFNSGYLRGRIVPGMILRARGKVQFFRGEPRMVNPKWQVVASDTARLTESVCRPIYPATGVMPSSAIERLIRNRLDAVLADVHEWFEPRLLKRRKVLGRRDAFKAIHQPSDLRQAAAARRRLVYDELMLLQLGLGLSRRERDLPLRAPVMKIDKLLDHRIRDRLKLTLTAAQDRAVWEIIGDMTGGRPMNRLLQGDVGSGKTAVAVYAMLACAANKLQSALLAPTEVLAEQHYLNLTNMLADSRVKIGLFTQRTRKQSRKSLAAELAAGEIHLAVGTQALLQEDVAFANLGLVVVDEQHRLGVLQRACLRDKATSPHYLVMTATPIPRTLALSYLADFDVSVIDELPPGRQPIQTKLLRPSSAAEAYRFVRDEISRGRQAYIVLPQVEDDGLDGAKSVLGELSRLKGGPLAGLRLASLHGQMNTEEKQSVMLAFRDGRIDVLVATTVIEVGIDVPNATVMLIDRAERFGLAQLHQLRGRVGRGLEKSHCILIAETAPDTPSDARLAAILQTHSGFEIAEMDLKLRGPGDFFGSRQHGLPQFKLADLSRELHLLAQAKDDAISLLKHDPNLTLPAHRHLRAALAKQFGQTLGLAQVG